MIASTTTPVSRLSVRHANASRRGSIAAAGLVAAVGAHIAVSGELDVIPIAPAIWAMLICAVALLGVRTAVFSKRSWPVTLALVVGSQLAMHVGMVKAPWAFGLRIHHEAVLIATGVVTRTYTSTTTGGGAFTASIPIRATTTIRATAAALGSPTITVISRERVTVKDRVRASRSATVVVSPALPGRALLLRPVGFQPLATARVRNGVATFHVPASAAGRAQVVIIPDGGRAERAQSSVFRIQ